MSNNKQMELDIKILYERSNALLDLITRAIKSIEVQQTQLSILAKRERNND